MTNEYHFFFQMVVTFDCTNGQFTALLENNSKIHKYQCFFRFCAYIGRKSFNFKQIQTYEKLSRYQTFQIDTQYIIGTKFQIRRIDILASIFVGFGVFLCFEKDIIRYVNFLPMIVAFFFVFVLSSVKKYRQIFVFFFQLLILIINQQLMVDLLKFYQRMEIFRMQKHVQISFVEEVGEQIMLVSCEFVSNIIRKKKMQVVCDKQVSKKVCVIWF
eukprot:TRINITY_DN5159_c0_g2_i4.p1 TRINITY_DN5159_c0_g2~~TRINITY_DN5159_c0_g2_i4.p1  ORF type:complete len:215 (-),score=-7.36 TRINITY_DN5159_c0_g2_i4:87-731(-)